MPKQSSATVIDSGWASECLNHRNDIKLAEIMQKLMGVKNTNQVIF